MDDYRVLLDWESIDTLKRSRGTHRRKLLAFIESLATNPFQVGEYQRTRGSREVEVKVLTAYLTDFLLRLVARHCDSVCLVTSLSRVSSPSTSSSTTPTLPQSRSLRLATQIRENAVSGKYAVYYWADHAVQEIKVIDIIRSIH